MSEEFFYKRSPKGKKRDDWIHDEILETTAENLVDGDLLTRLQSFHRAVINREQDPIFAQQIYSIEPADLGTKENKKVVASRSGRGIRSYSISRGSDG